MPVSGVIWGIPVTILPDERTSKALKDAKSLVQCLAAYFGTLRSGDYCALLAYLERNNRYRDALQDIWILLRDSRRVATCLGFGLRGFRAAPRVRTRLSSVQLCHVR